MTMEIPSEARVVIIGGGIIGCSVAYHLTKEGVSDVLLLERKQLTSGTTWAAAGLVAQLRATKPMTELAVYGSKLYETLEAETGQSTGYVQSGSLLVAQTEDRLHEYRRGEALGKALGIDVHPVDMEEAKRLVPFLETEGLAGAYHMPGDGQTDPSRTAQALAKGAVNRGAKIVEGVVVTGIGTCNNAVTGVYTDHGNVKCEIVVNCAGMWGREVGKMVGVAVPLFAAEHMHMVTAPVEGAFHGMTTVRDFDGYIYLREESGGLLLGGFEPKAKPWGRKGIPETFSFTELPEDWDQFELFLETGIKRFPVLENAEIRHLTVVPESFTPDNAYMLGEAPGMKNFFVACGMNSVGIASAGGAGKALSEWILQGYPETELTSLDVKRYHPWQINLSYLVERTREVVGVLYHRHYPFRQRETARPVIRSVVHHRLAEMNACFGEAFGWERANWFAPDGVEPVYRYTWDRPDWLEYSAAEHMAVREGVGVYDLSSMAKFRLEGPDAEKILQKICAANLHINTGRIVYTPLLNERGGFEADLTVTKLDADTFFIVTAGANAIRDADRIRRSIPAGGRALLTDVTHAYTMLAVMGPKSRDLLQRITDDDLSSEAFPYRTAKTIDLAYARPLALRISYVGELGWEFYIPAGFAVTVFDALFAAGKDLGLKPVGLTAVDSLRLEKGYRHFGSDITPDDTPLEAGLGFTVAMKKGDFIGRDALMKQRTDGIKRKLVMFPLNDPQPLIYHDEPIYRNGTFAGLNTHGAYAHHLGAAAGMVYLENPDGVTEEWIRDARYEIDLEGRMIPVTIHTKPPYDPTGARMKE